jgi:hypothetical protein
MIYEGLPNCKEILALVKAIKCGGTDDENDDNIQVKVVLSSIIPMTLYTSIFLLMIASSSA